MMREKISHATQLFFRELVGPRGQQGLLCNLLNLL